MADKKKALVLDSVPSGRCLSASNVLHYHLNEDIIDPIVGRIP